jgi:hypothetical protein
MTIALAPPLPSGSPLINAVRSPQPSDGTIPLPTHAMVAGVTERAIVSRD